MGQPKQRQAGIVAIMVTVTLMLVISLIVIGFAQVSRSEQRANSDRKQSEQAFLAAESGINDARKQISQYLSSGQIVPAKSTCLTDPTLTPAYPFNPVIDANAKVSYSCMIITPQLSDILADIPSDGRSVALPLEPAGGTIGTLQVRWAAKTPTPQAVGSCSGSVPLSGGLKSITSGSWTCPYGMLRIELVPTTVLSRAAMTAGRKVYFVHPINLGGTASRDITTTLDGSIIPMNCDATNCKLDIFNLHLSATTWMVRISAIYSGGDIRLVGLDSVTSAPLGLQNSQVQIDVTGKANDVLRRVQVRVPVNNNAGTIPEYAIESASSICKRFESTGNDLNNASDIQGQDPLNPLCASF